jgi:hypothetical protein
MMRIYRDLFQSGGICGLILYLILGGTAFAQAQQPVAMITALAGEVFVSIEGQPPAAATVGTVLSEGDTIQTSANAFVVLELSDGSELELDENTNLQLAELQLAPESGARTSRLKLWWGRVRSFLSPGHQAAGSKFDVQTPNALVGVKFSQPHTEVAYNQTTQETTVVAHQFDVLVTNLLTGATKLIPQGSSAIVQGKLIQEIGRILQPTFDGGQPASEPPQPTGEVPEGMSSAGAGGSKLPTLAVVGVGVAATAGGIAALASNAEGDSDSSEAPLLSGTFQRQQTLHAGVTQTIELSLSQNGQTVSGTRTDTVVVEGCCTAVSQGNITGTLETSTIAQLTVIRGAGECRCGSAAKAASTHQAQITVVGDDNAQIIGVQWDEEISKGPATLEQSGRVLRYHDNDYLRQ